jgi:hypothetical protein
VFIIVENVPAVEKSKVPPTDAKQYCLLEKLLAVPLPLPAPI